MQDLWSLGDDGYSIYRVPGLCVTSEGTLLAFAEARSKDKPQVLVTKRSTDGGKTWSEQQIVYTEHSADPSPLIDWQTGELFLALRGRNPRGHGPRGPLQAFLMRSADDGRSWSDRRPFGILREDMRILTPGPAHGIQLRRGQYRERLVMPVYFYLKEGRQTCGVAYSDDHGKTWKLGGGTPHNTHEPQVCELDDGRLLLTCRDHSKGPEGRGRGVAFSRDGGATFGDYRKDDELPSYGCQATAMRYCLPGQDAEDCQHNPLLFSAPAEGRRRMTVMLSEDDGETWPVSRLVYAGHSAYSAMRVLPDGRIGLLYERDHYRRVSFATFTLDWLRGRE